MKTSEVRAAFATLSKERRAKYVVLFSGREDLAESSGEEQFDAVIEADARNLDALAAIVARAATGAPPPAPASDEEPAAEEGAEEEPAPRAQAAEESEEIDLREVYPKSAKRMGLG